MIPPVSQERGIEARRNGSLLKKQIELSSEEGTCTGTRHYRGGRVTIGKGSGGGMGGGGSDQFGACTIELRSYLWSW